MWADGDARKPSASHLYFTDATAERVWRMPTKFDGDAAKPEPVAFPAAPAGGTH